MVNGNYIFNGDRPSSESETVDDHVHTRTVERKNKRKSNRTANELQKSLNQAHLDNETDSIKYEKKVKEPKLLRYVSSKEVEQNFVSDKLDETFDFKPTVEIARRHAFTKKPKNPADGSPNYVYSRSSSNCSSPTGNLPTISEHAENYGTYRVCAPPSPTVSEIINGYENKFDKYFAKPREVKKLAVKGSHPDSLYRVTTGSGAGATKIMRTLRVLRWPFALLTVCVALAVFVYFLMPENMEPGFKSDLMNGTYWETGFAETQTPLPEKYKHPVTTNPTIGKKGTHATLKPGLKTSEIDFYEEDINKKEEFTTQADTITENTPKRKLPLEPVFPTHITPEVQYGDSQKIRTPKLLDKTNTVADDSTLKPHITQKPERPLEIYFKESDALNTMSTENIPRAENSNDFTNYGEKQSKKTVQPVPVPYPIPYKELSSLLVRPRAKDNLNSRQYAAPDLPPELQEVYSLPSAVNSDVNFTSGHSKLFGISIEDAEKFKSTTQNSIYNTRVSPTLPTWRDGDDTTKKYPVNITSDVHQCRSTRLPVCRGILPYDLAGAAETIAGVDVSTYLPQIEYLIATNCSDRLKHFMCALLEPECNGPPYKPKLPCHNLCKAITDGCEGHIPRELMPMLKCNQYTTNNCVAAKTPCFQRELQCGDGSCVPRDWMCDGTRDCPAGEDEAQCAQCDSNEFTCPSGGCVLNRWLCDGYSDCDKGEDEDPERCGSGHYVAAATSDLGEESAGSAPAPSVRRPNRVQSNKSHRNTGENDSSKELLVTSDSTNAFKRNFTRRPSLSRLTPYTRPALREKHNEQKAKVETKTVHTTISPKDETPEQELMRDLGILEVLEKESKMYKEKIPKSQQQKPFLGRAPTPSFSEKSVNKMEKVIDGAAMLQKAVNSDIETPATKEEDSDERNGTDDDDESYEAPIPSPNPKSLSSKAIGHNDPTQGKGVTGGSYTAHASPCPAGELRCVDGRCITLAQLCDGTIDCTDHADEDNCYT